jgi:hypothetical protein
MDKRQAEMEAAYTKYQFEQKKSFKSSPSRSVLGVKSAREKANSMDYGNQ